MAPSTTRGMEGQGGVLPYSWRAQHGRHRVQGVGAASDRALQRARHRSVAQRGAPMR